MKNVFILTLLLLAFGNLCAQQKIDFGLAKWKIDGIDYLIDESGQRYKVAYKLEDLNEEVTALVLGGLSSFPLELVQYPQLNVQKLVTKERS